jgi:adenylate kinase
MFRAAVASGTALGHQVSELLAAGLLVPDVVTDQVVAERLVEPDAVDGWLLDGYPRTLGQVSALQACMAHHGVALDGVLAIIVPTEELLKRLLLRADIEDRADDTAETITRRLAVYHEQTEPVIEQYAASGFVVRVDGVGSVAEVATRIATVLDPLTESAV